jgi:serine/threonine protein kinase
MNICKDHENILKCIDAYDFNKKIMLFLEYMDVGALT